MLWFVWFVCNVLNLLLCIYLREWVLNVNMSCYYLRVVFGFE